MEILYIFNFIISVYVEWLLFIFNYDYLVLEMGYGVDMGEMMYIWVEKIKFEEGDVGIIIVVDLDFERMEG